MLRKASSDPAVYRCTAEESQFPILMKTLVGPGNREVLDFNRLPELGLRELKLRHSLSPLVAVLQERRCSASIVATPVLNKSLPSGLEGYHRGPSPVWESPK